MSTRVHSWSKFINCKDLSYKHTSHGRSRPKVPLHLAVSFFLFFERFFSHYFRFLISWWPLCRHLSLMRMILHCFQIPWTHGNHRLSCYHLVSWTLMNMSRSPLLLVQRGDDEITNTVAMLDRIDTNSESKDLQTKILRIDSLNLNSMFRGIIGGSGGLPCCTRVWCSTTAHKQ